MDTVVFFKAFQYPKEVQSLEELPSRKLGAPTGVGHIVRTPTWNQVGQNLFWKNRFWVGPDGGPKPGGSIWVGHKFVGGALS